MTWSLLVGMMMSFISVSHSDEGTTGRAVLILSLTFHSCQIPRFWDRYESTTTGTKALQLLERVSVERFGAKVVTLDTLAYVIIESECKTYHLEDTNVPSRNVGWYGRKGYAKFRVSCNDRQC